MFSVYRFNLLIYITKNRNTRVTFSSTPEHIPNTTSRSEPSLAIKSFSFSSPLTWIGDIFWHFSTTPWRNCLAFSKLCEHILTFMKWRIDYRSVDGGRNKKISILSANFWVFKLRRFKIFNSCWIWLCNLSPQGLTFYVFHQTLVTCVQFVFALIADRTIVKWCRKK